MRETYFVDWSEAELLSSQGQAALEEHVFGRFDICLERVVPWIAKRRQLHDARVLEIGCGTGSSTAALACSCANVDAYDIDARGIAGAARRLSLLELSNVTLNHISPDRLIPAIRAKHSTAVSDGVDIVLFYAVLEHQTPNERLESLSTAWEVLTPGGLLVVVDTPNRLTWTDRHTSFLPFYHGLPTEIATRYARYSDRAHLRHDMATSLARDDTIAADQLARWGRGVSYHEFELALGDLTSLVVGDGFDDEILSHQPPTLDERLLYTYWLSNSIDKPLGFVRESLDLILRKPDGNPPPSIHRDLSHAISPLYTEQIGVRGAIKCYLDKLRRRYL